MEFFVTQLSFLFFTNSKVYSKSSPSKMKYLDWLHICKWAAEEAEKLPHTAPSDVILPCKLWQNHIWSHNYSAGTTDEFLIKGYFVFPGSWGQNLSSWDDAHYYWVYTQKGGIRQRRGFHGATQSLNWTQVSETNCSGGLTSISLQIKCDGGMVFPPRKADGAKYGCGCIILRRTWQVLIVSLSIVLYIYKSQYKLYLINDKSLNTLELN